MHVCSNSGQAPSHGGSGAGVAANATLVSLTDGWTWHCVGCDSDNQLGSAIDYYLNNSQVSRGMRVAPWCFLHVNLNGIC